MTLVFSLLTIEIGIVSFLLLPLPPKFQNFLLKKYNELLNNSNFKIILIFIDVLISIMFVDSCKNGIEFFKNKDEIIEFTNNKNNWDLKSKKFYSQRNLYILGAILSLQVAVWFMSILFKSIIKNKSLLVELSKDNNSSSSSTSSSTVELQDKIKKAELDVSTLKKQYDSLYEQYEKKNSTPIESNTVKKDK
ncbi:hypothetical protein C6P40_005497 [Pichia californica]|uniref:Endoplasmic reticulum transmembrane protein n=1 Tax=Pichia californica TaxID=460514 RepID=A0A9P7BEC5_9ASCO|nr:hypothetical protein C6P42_003591 [[Candida] californica]KAG0689162.1 hypothetical protein C6P40_005497 [[Candida] californica]